MRKPLRGRRSGPFWFLSLIFLYVGYSIVIVYIQGHLEWWKPFLLAIVSLFAIILVGNVTLLISSRPLVQNRGNSSHFSLDTKPTGLASSKRHSIETRPSKIKLDPTLKLNPTWTYAQRQITDLPIRRDMDRLASFILNPGGNKLLLTGYESFGGTSLVRGAIKKAQNELHRRHLAAESLCVFHFDVIENTQGLGKFDIMVNGVRFGQVHAKDTSTLSDELEDIIPEINLTTPLRVSLLSKFTQKLVRGEKKITLNFNSLASGLAQLFEDNFKKSRLQEELRQRLGKSMEPVNAVIILGRINHLETLELFLINFAPE